MANDPPADIQESDRIVRAWEATAKPGELPPLEVHAHALKLHNHLGAQGASQPQLSAIDRFKLMPRSDQPPTMPAWSRPALADNPAERASDRFKRLRLANVDQQERKSNAK